MIDHILKSCGVGALDVPTTIFEGLKVMVLVLHKWNHVTSSVT
jgi:hypothetical protein